MPYKVRGEELASCLILYKGSQPILACRLDC